MPTHFSPKSEPLAQVGELPLILYSIGFGLAFLVFGEMLGLSERRIIRFSVRRLILYFLAAFLASLALLLGVWIIEFSFVGRFAILKIGLSTGLVSFFLFWLFNTLARQSRTRIFLLTAAESSQSIRSSFSEQSAVFEWVDSEGAGTGNDLVEFCKDEKVDLIVMDQSPEAGKVEIIPLLEAGTRVMGLVDFWERYLEKIPPRQVDQSWLAKLDLRLRDPFSHKLKRLADLVLAVFGLLLSLPLVLPVLVVIAVDSGFPLFFKQTRTGFMGRPYTLYKLRTMKRMPKKRSRMGEGERPAGHPVWEISAQVENRRNSPVLECRQGRDVDRRSPSRETGVSGGTDQKGSSLELPSFSQTRIDRVGSNSLSLCLGRR